MSADRQTPAIILHSPQMGENIGAAARVMGNFGLPDLRIIDPRDGWPNDKAFSMAAGSPVLAAAKVVTDMAEASADLTRIYACYRNDSRKLELLLPYRQRCYMP